MSGDPIERLPIAFGRVLARRRGAKSGVALALAESVGLTDGGLGTVFGNKPL